MEIKDLQGKRVAVLGYGVEGKAVTRYLLKHGIEPAVLDQKLWDEWPEEEQEQIKSLGINFISGPNCFKELEDFDVAFRSPGIKLSQLTVKNLQLTSQTKFFFENCPGKIIGVTGTKGKGTTCALIYEMLKPQYQIPKIKYPNIYLTGNIGKVQPLEILDNLKPQDWVVYELSSFQLQDLTKSPHIGVVLMLTSEHLDYHCNADEYQSAKEAIVKFQKAGDFAIINADFGASMKIGALGKGKKRFFSLKKQADCCIKSGLIYAKLKGSTPVRLDSPSSARRVEPFMDTAGLQLRGRHNLENICAAILAARCAGADDGAIKKAGVNFKGLEHRLEFVTEKNGIKFYNDSFSTTPETAIAAINSFAEPLIVILGGSSKNSDFGQLAKTISRAKNIKTLILIGRETDRIRAALAGEKKFNGTLLTGAKSMADIFWQIKFAAKAGDVALLSPACASFDMFKNYRDRGEQFKERVKNS